MQNYVVNGSLKKRITTSIWFQLHLLYCYYFNYSSEIHEPIFQLVSCSEKIINVASERVRWLRKHNELIPWENQPVSAKWSKSKFNCSVRMDKMCPWWKHFGNWIFPSCGVFYLITSCLKFDLQCSSRIFFAGFLRRMNAAKIGHPSHTVKLDWPVFQTIGYSFSVECPTLKKI